MRIIVTRAASAPQVQAVVVADDADDQCHDGGQGDEELGEQLRQGHSFTIHFTPRIVAPTSTRGLSSPK